MGLNIKDLTIASTDFDAGGRIGDDYAYDKGNKVPRMVISGVPEETVELAIICHDPDAPLPHGFTHWLLYGLAPDATDLTAEALEAARAGENGFGESGWGGPQPPPGHGTHHYYFWVYALDRAVDGTPSREEFLDAYGDSIIEQNRVIGTYSN